MGQQVVLARFELPPQYCGVLRFFAQFTDTHAKDPSQVATPGLQWLILLNKRPLYPYVSFEHIVNPWGNGSFEVSRSTRRERHPRVRGAALKRRR